MTARSRTGLLCALALLGALAAPLAARADQAYDRVAAAYAQAGGKLDPCAFGAADLEAALRGIPPTIASAVPDLKRAIQDGIAAHRRGDCRGRRPTEAATGGAAPGTTPPVATAPPATSPAQTAPAAPPAATAAQPTAPASTAPAQPAAGGGSGHGHDRRPLVVALIAAGALLLLALLLGGWARMRGWDPAWVARVRHGWGEAGFRATSTWSEFADWLRLGR